MKADRTETRLANLLDELGSGGWNPGEVAEWDEYQTDYWYTRICESSLYRKSLALAAVSVELLYANLPGNGRPSCGIRGVMYLALSAGWLPDSGNTSYTKIQNLLVRLRRSGIVDYGWITDDCRSTIKPTSWAGMDEYVDICRNSYRKDFWSEMPFYIDVIVEKQTLANLLEPVTEEYDIPLEPLRGFSSDTFVYSIGSLWRTIDKPIVVLFISDFDPSGLDIERDAKEKLCLHSGREIGPDLTWKRLAVLPEHFDEFGITPLEVKDKDKRGKKFIERFGTRCCEAEAIPPKELRRILRDEIESLIPQDKWQMLQQIEAAERETFDQVMDAMRNGTSAANDAQASDEVESMRPADDDLVDNADPES